MSHDEPLTRRQPPTQIERLAITCNALESAHREIRRLRRVLREIKAKTLPHRYARVSAASPRGRLKGEVMNMVKANQSNWIEDERVKLLRRDVARLRRALRQITRSKWEHSDYLAACKCGRCIATRALKGAK